VGKSLLPKGLPNSGETELVCRLFQHLMNVIDGVVLFSESKDALSDGVAFGGAVRASLRCLEKLSFRILAEFMAQDRKLP